MPIKVGDIAPDFTLPDQDRRPRGLADYRGRNLLLMFFPFAFTDVCAGELCELRDRRNRFEAEGAEVVSVSCDPTGSLRAFADREGLSYPLLSDFWPHGRVAQEYGVFVPEFGVANRVTFLIDPDGIVRWTAASSLDAPRDADDYVEALAALGQPGAVRSR